ncbi:hypothetical protein [Pectobacterium phage PEAT2]|uniref:Uncharacterized protein n=1 Tax=Pectobacterium phage PEAT2 TaxID=2053078 RepID=A0A2H4N7D4_9CAUD|nr:hypothetical protein F8206_gp29 [Pectobacterium phage PEAT2]ATV25097.1 hypothetical protein [Pectobacterium phage PEAT2]
MTLLELLRQELPKRGGWPEGAGFAWQDDDGEVRFSNGTEHDFHPKDELLISEKVRPRNYIRVRSCDAFVVTREQYEATGWDGVGLPPIGVECEWQDKNTGQWQPVKVVYASEWVTVIREINEEKGDDLVEIAIENYGDDARLKLRPLRTEAERAIDEMVRLSGVSIGAAKILYNAGYRK